jgi:hypothetical protein
MRFASIRLIAADIKALVGFYEKVTGTTAEWLAGTCVRRNSDPFGRAGFR